jgi:2-dehydro-3-deoxyphosphogluconate aldolase / (4S)-4-hydroxy-2-oxoglutarate aldolase
MTDWINELRNVRALPVIVIDDLADAVPMCRALVDGGLRLLEVTLRTPPALEAIALLAKELPDAIVGAGTITNAADYRSALAAGARFCVSPGQTGDLLAAATGNVVPLIPGCSSASDIMAARNHGYRLVKFFPAEAIGGAPALKSFTGPFPDQLFVPTGGISPANAEHYRAIPAVLTVGGSWMLPAAAIKARDWAKVAALAKAC